VQILDRYDCDHPLYCQIIRPVFQPKRFYNCLFSLSSANLIHPRVFTLTVLGEELQL
jgi:hypothetical protein